MNLKLPGFFRRCKVAWAGFDLRGWVHSRGIGLPRKLVAFIGVMMNYRLMDIQFTKHLNKTL